MFRGALLFLFTHLLVEVSVQFISRGARHLASWVLGGRSTEAQLEHLECGHFSLTSRAGELRILQQSSLSPAGTLLSS